jgi:SAM-dependent methyltransferase
MMTAAPIAKPTAELSAPKYRWIDQCPLCRTGHYDVIRTEENVFGASDTAYVKMYEKPPVNLRRCKGCGFAFTERIPDDPEYYRQIYAYGYDYEYEYHHNAKDVAFHQARRQILKHVQNGRLLDIGAANGYLMKFFSDVFQPQGVEISAGPAQFARGKGWHVDIGLYQDIELPENTFNVITMIDVLEHLPEPGQILEKNFRLLKPGGVMFIKVPNYTSQIAKQDFLQKIGSTREGIMANFCHINHFTPDSLSGHLKKLGFDVVARGYTPVSIHIPRPNATFVQRLKAKVSNAIRLFFTWVCNTIASLTGAPLGFNFYVLARKPLKG